MENKVLAVVDGREVTQRDMDVLISHLGQQALQFANPEGEKRLLDELINEELFYSHGKELNIEEDAEFQAELEKSKATLIKQYMIRKTVMEVRVEDNEIEAYYEENKAQFTKPESVQASHILVDTEEEATSIATEINGGLSFEEAASKYSKCPSKERGGDLGFFSRGQMVPEFENASFELAVGELSEPVQTQFGFHLIKVVDKNDAGVSSLDEVRYNLLQTLTAKKQSDAYLAKVDELMKKFPVEIK